MQLLDWVESEIVRIFIIEGSICKFWMVDWLKTARWLIDAQGESHMMPEPSGWINSTAR